MKIIIHHDGEPDEVSTCKCGAELETCPLLINGREQPRTQYAFAMTHKRDGTPIKHLESKGPFLGIMELGWCPICQQHSVVIDCTDDKEFWASLPKWEAALC